MKADRCRILLVRSLVSIGEAASREGKGKFSTPESCEKTRLDRGSRCHRQEREGRVKRSLVCALEQTCRGGCLMSYLGCAMSSGEAVRAGF